MKHLSSIPCPTTLHEVNNNDNNKGQQQRKQQQSTSQTQATNESVVPADAPMLQRAQALLASMGVASGCRLQDHFESC
eukprot:3907053-Amphidinium_carterae.1